MCAGWGEFVYNYCRYYTGCADTAAAVPLLIALYCVLQIEEIASDPDELNVLSVDDFDEIETKITSDLTAIMCERKLTALLCIPPFSHMQCSY